MLCVGCLTSQQHVSVSQGQICSHSFMCCHTEIEAAYQTLYLIQPQYTDTGPTSPSTDLVMSGAWQGSHWSANFKVNGMTRAEKVPLQAGFKPHIFRSAGGHLNHSADKVVKSGQKLSPSPWCTRTFPDPDVHVLDGWMPAIWTKRSKHSPSPRTEYDYLWGGTRKWPCMQKSHQYGQPHSPNPLTLLPHTLMHAHTHAYMHTQMSA